MQPAAPSSPVRRRVRKISRERSLSDDDRGVLSGSKRCFKFEDAAAAVIRNRHDAAVGTQAREFGIGHKRGGVGRDTPPDAVEVVDPESDDRSHVGPERVGGRRGQAGRAHHDHGRQGRTHPGRSPEELHPLTNVQSVIETLPPRLREIAEELKTHSVTEIAQQHGMSRRHMHRLVNKIRQHFDEAGLRGYLR